MWQGMESLVNSSTLIDSGGSTQLDWRYLGGEIKHDNSGPTTVDLCMRHERSLLGKKKDDDWWWIDPKRRLSCFPCDKSLCSHSKQDCLATRLPFWYLLIWKKSFWNLMPAAVYCTCSWTNSRKFFASLGKAWEWQGCFGPSAKQCHPSKGWRLASEPLSCQLQIACKSKERKSASVDTHKDVFSFVAKSQHATNDSWIEHES